MIPLGKKIRSYSNSNSKFLHVEPSKKQAWIQLVQVIIHVVRIFYPLSVWSVWKMNRFCVTLTRFFCSFCLQSETCLTSVLGPLFRGFIYSVKIFVRTMYPTLFTNSTLPVSHIQTDLSMYIGHKKKLLFHLHCKMTPSEQ